MTQVIPVIFYWYDADDFNKEKNFTTEMIQIPCLGESVHLGDENIAIKEVYRVTWTFDSTRKRWHAEVYLS